jgi:hypothetical protein
MKTIKVSEATGPALDWLVAKCEEQRGVKFGTGFSGEMLLLDKHEFGHRLDYLTNWAQGGPIIERERINLHLLDDKPDIWAASLSNPWKALPNVFSRLGPTPLIAAMRCYVASKLGDTAKVPEELL